MTTRLATTIKAVLLLLVSLLVAGLTVQAVAADPTPHVPTQAPYIEAPQPAAGTPADPVPSRPPTPRPCPGQTTIHLPGAPVPFVYCPKAKPGESGVSDDDPSKISNDQAPAFDPDSCNGALDLGCQARHAVTGWFRNLVRSAIGPTFRFLGATVFGTPDIDSPQMSRTRDIWAASRTIADTCFVLLISIAGVMLMTGTTLSREMGPREVLPRLVVAFLAANLSLVLIGHAIRFANGLANAFLQAGKQQIDPRAAAETMGRSVEQTVNTGPLFLIFIALVAVVLALILALIYIARLAITMVLIAAAPLALMFHALPSTDGLAVLWWRALTGMLAIQVCQSLVFVTALQILLSDPGPSTGGAFPQVPTTKQDGLDLLLLICMLYVLVRIPSWVSRTIWRQAQPRLLSQVVKSFVVYRGVGALLSKVAPGRQAHHSSPRTPGGGGGGGGRPHRGPGGGTGGPGPSGGGHRRTGPASGGGRGPGSPGGGPAPNGPGTSTGGAANNRQGRTGGPQPGGPPPHGGGGRGAPTGSSTPADATGPTSAYRPVPGNRRRTTATGAIPFPTTPGQSPPLPGPAPVIPLRPRRRPGTPPPGEAIVLRLEPQPPRRPKATDRTTKKGDRHE